MSEPILSGSVQTDQATLSHQPSLADLLAHVSLLQEALDVTAPTEAALVRAERQITALQDQVARLSTQIAEGQRRADALEQEVEHLHGSLSWRVTAPLRALRGLLRQTS